MITDEQKLVIQKKFDNMQFMSRSQVDSIVNLLTNLDNDSQENNITNLRKFIGDVQFLSPNEPMTPYGVQRILEQIDAITYAFETIVGNNIVNRTITLWDPNISYSRNDIVLYFKQETKQNNVEFGMRKFAFILVSTKDNNTSIPNYDLVNGIPSFFKSNWNLLNPTSYLLQDMTEMKRVVQEVIQQLIDEHVKKNHKLIDGTDVELNLVKKDYSNLITPNRYGKYTVSNLDSTFTINGQTNRIKLDTNGIMEYSIKFSYDEKVNQLDSSLVINDKRYYYQASPIWDESDRTIFAQKYIENDLFSIVSQHPKTNGYGQAMVDANGNAIMKVVKFNNLRYGTNIFHAKVEFPSPFVNDEYCVFFDTYGEGEFVFGYDKQDLESKLEPTYDAIVSQPMIMNKSTNGFDVVLPIHTYFNSISKYNIGVPWNNLFNVHVIGRYR